jgi:hypothetical protein
LTALWLFLREDQARSTHAEGAMKLGRNEVRLPVATTSSSVAPETFPGGPAVVHHIRGGWWYVCVDRDDW